MSHMTCYETSWEGEGGQSQDPDDPDVRSDEENEDAHRSSRIQVQ